jgi:aspartate/methionine/tyrosine aminotransferase
MNVMPFELARFQHENRHRAKHVLGGSGLAPAPVSMLSPHPASFGDADEPAYRTAVAHARGVDVGHVLAAVGGTEALFMALFGLVSPGDRVLVETPTYYPLREIPRALGARVQSIPREMSEDWRLDVDEAIRLLDRDVSVVAITNPNNPTGRLTPARDLLRLAEACAEVDAWLVVDDIFGPLTQPRPPVSHALHPRIVSTGSLTKCHGLSGLRAGWTIGAPEAMTLMKRAKGLSTIVGPSLSVPYAIEALRREDELLARGLRITHENHTRWRGFLARHPELSWRAPDCPLIAAVKLPAGVDDIKFCEALLADQGVLVVPGTFVELPGFVRVGFGCEPASFSAGLDGFGRALDALR